LQSYNFIKPNCSQHIKILTSRQTGVILQPHEWFYEAEEPLINHYIWCDRYDYKES